MGMRPRSFPRVAAILLLLAGCGTTPVDAPALDTVYRMDFEDGRAAGWGLEPGWEVVRDGDGHVLSGRGHAWARADRSFGDARLAFRVKLLQGTVHLVLRMNDEGRYFIGFGPDGSSLSKQLWPDTFQHDLAGAAAAHRLGEWHQVLIVGSGATLRFVVDGRTEWEYKDPRPLLEGAFAFETLDDSSASLDDVAVAIAAALAPSGPAASSGRTGSAPVWIATGGPLGGLGYDVRMRPDDPDTLFVTDAFAGVFTSTDGGRSWSASNTGITTRTGATGDAIPVFSLTIDPRNPDTIWAGTQNTRGIFKSVDGGRSWREMDAGVVEQGGISFRGFAVDPTDSNTVYAAAELASWVWNRGEPRQGIEFDMTAGVVYKTTDGGRSWKPVWRGDNLARYIWIDPRDPKVLYVSTGIFDREAANSDPAAGKPGGVGIVKSTDGGKTWKPANKGLANLYVGTLFMHPTNPDILLAGTGAVHAQDGAGVYLSTDGGASWRRTLSSIFIESVECSAADPSIAYAGDAYGIYRSADGGRTWRLVSGNVEPDNRSGWGSPGVRGGHPIDFQADPRARDRLFANAYGGGAFLSEDGGRTWKDASKGYTGALVRDIAVDPTDAARVIAASRSGIFASENGGADWRGVSYPALYCSEWEAIAVDPAHPRHLLASNNWLNALASSSDGGRTWSVAAKSPEGTAVGWRSIAFAPSDPATVYAGSAGYRSAGAFDPSVPGRGIFASPDGGSTWHEANDALSRDAHVADLAVDARDPRRLLAATTNHGVLQTADGGRAWQRVGGGLPPGASLSVAVSPGDSSILLAGFDRGALFRSGDGGRTWKRSSRGLEPEASIASIVFDPVHPENVYAADTFSGVYRSTDAGSTWKLLNDGLSLRAVNALALSSDGKHLYAASEGGGVFRLDLDGRPPETARAGR